MIFHFNWFAMHRAICTVLLSYCLVNAHFEQLPLDLYWADAVDSILHSSICAPFCRWFGTLYRSLNKWWYEVGGGYRLLESLSGRIVPGCQTAGRYCGWILPGYRLSWFFLCWFWQPAHPGWDLKHLIWQNRAVTEVEFQQMPGVDNNFFYYRSPHIFFWYRGDGVGGNRIQNYSFIEGCGCVAHGL